MAEARGGGGPAMTARASGGHRQDRAAGLGDATKDRDSSHVQDLKLVSIKSLMLGSRVEQKRHEHTTLQPIITLIWQC